MTAEGAKEPGSLSGLAVRILGETFFRLTGRRSRPAETLAAARSILVIRPDEIGDVVMTSPFLRELRGNAPGAWITLAVKPEVMNLVERCPHVNEVVAWDWKAQGAHERWTLHGRALQLSRKRLWRRRFDLALLPRSGADYYHAAFLAFFSGTARRVGYSRSGWDVEPPRTEDYDALLTDAVECPRNFHEVERNLHMIRALGGKVGSTALEAWIGAEDEAKADSLLRAGDDGSDRALIAFGPGGGQARKCWPAERFIEVGRRLAAEISARIVVVGGAEDQAKEEEIARGVGSAATNLAGRTTLRETTAVLKRCALFVGNDSGPMHLAAAAGTRVALISCHPRDGAQFFLNAPERFGPWGVESVTLRPPEGAGGCRATCVADRAHCILGVTAKEVRQAAESILAGERTSA